jgi:hypothetical protein
MMVELDSGTISGLEADRFRAGAAVRNGPLRRERAREQQGKNKHKCRGARPSGVQLYR